MRDLGRRLLIGLAVVAAAVMAIGYAFIAGRIAAPIESDLGTLDAGIDAQIQEIARALLGEPKLGLFRAHGVGVPARVRVHDEKMHGVGADIQHAQPHNTTLTLRAAGTVVAPGDSSGVQFPFVRGT